MAILATLLALVSPTCPPWCPLPAGHTNDPGTFDPAGGDRFIAHELPIATDIGSWNVDLVRHDVELLNGPSEVGDPSVLLNGDYLRPLGIAEARELAAALVRAADTAEEHGAGHGRHAVDSPTVVIPAVAGAA